MPFLFDNAATIDGLVQQLRVNAWQGAIVGPHGTGKSTLLAMLVPAIEAVGRRSVVVGLRDGQRRLPLSRRELQNLGPTDVLVIDGYEQLGSYSRWRLPKQSRRRGLGLLVTAHSACNLPVLWRTEPSLALVEELINHCLPPHGGLINRQDVEAAWQRHAGNVREVFFALYDQFEARRPIVRITTELPVRVTNPGMATIGRGAPTA
jgi:hypothetical protein